MVHLSDVCSILMGQSPSSNTYNTAQQGLPFYQGNADFGAIYPKKRVWCSSPVKIAKAGDILISVRAPIGALNIADTECCIGRGLAALSANEDVCLRKYLWYVLKFNASALINKGTGSTFKAINKQVLMELEFDLPSIEKQAQIVEQLDKTTTIISKKTSQLAKLDELVKSQFIEMFGDPFIVPKCGIKKLQDIAISLIDGSNVDTVFYKESGDVLFLRIQNVWRNEFRLDDSVYISQDINARYIDTSLKTGDLLITKIGRFYTKDSSLGRVSIYRGKDDKANYSNNIMRVRLNNTMNSEYVNALLNLDDYQSYIRKTSKGGTDKRALSKSLIGSYPIICPPIELQNEFARFVEQTDKSKNDYELRCAA